RWDFPDSWITPACCEFERDAIKRWQQQPPAEQALRTLTAQLAAAKGRLATARTRGAVVPCWRPPRAAASGCDGGVSGPRRTLAVGLFEEALADADGQRRHFHQLVIGNELHRILQRELDRGSQKDGIVLAGGADVGELLGLDRVHDQVVVAAVDADDHSLVELLARADEHAPALLQIEQRVGHRLTLLVAHQHAVVTVGNVALDGRVAVEDVADQPGAAGQRHELTLEPDQPACRYAVLQARAPVPVDRHVSELGATGAERLHDGALVLDIDVDGQRLVGLVHLAVDDLRQHLGARYRELVAFASHVLDQNRQVQLAATGDAQDIRLVSVLDAQGDVALQLALQPLAQLAAGDILPLAAGVGRGVDLKVHRQGRLVDADRRQARGRERVAHRQADVHILDAGDRHDVPGKGLLHRGSLQAVEGEHLADFRRAVILVPKTQCDRLPGTHGAAADP